MLHPNNLEQDNLEQDNLEQDNLEQDNLSFQHEDELADPDSIEEGRSPKGKPSGPNTKGGKTVARQNFSLHPDLMQAILHSMSQLNTERTTAILDDRARRVTYSKVVSALAWILKTHYLTPEGDITPAFRLLIASFEASPFERPNDTDQADQIMERRRRYVASLLRGTGTEPFSTAHLPFLNEEDDV